MGKNDRYRNDSGNAFFIILLGVVLFAALMFTFSRSVRQGGENISIKKAEIMATDLISHAQRVERTVNLMRRRSVSENDISFENTFDAGYVNAGCADNSCRVFAGSPSILYLSPPEGANDGTQWVFTGNNFVDGLGAVGDRTDSELLMILPNVLQSVCTQINEYLGISGIPEEDGNSSLVKYTGTFSNTPDNIAENGGGTALERVKTGCFENMGDNTYRFYHVLIQRP
jgi:hypothetical protein